MKVVVINISYIPLTYSICYPYINVNPNIHIFNIASSYKNKIDFIKLSKRRKPTS